MPVVIGIGSPGNIEPIPQSNERCHGIRRRAIHANLAVPIHRHKAESLIDIRVHHFQLKAVVFRNAGPILHTRTAHWVHPQFEPGTANGLHVDHLIELIHVTGNIVVPVRGGRTHRGF